MSSKHRARFRRGLGTFILGLVISAVIAALPAASTAQAGDFGFSYWPYCTSNPLGDSNISLDAQGQDWWSDTPDPGHTEPYVRPTVARDLDHIASLGAGVVRFVIGPYGKQTMSTAPCTPAQKTPARRGDWVAWELPAPSSGSRGNLNTAEFGYQKSNVADLITLAKYRRLKVIVTFANLYMHLEDVNNPDPNPNDNRTPKLWETHYGTANWNLFLADAKDWVNGYVTAIENCWCKDAVIAYDYLNESSERIVDAAGRHNAWEYVKYLYDNSAIPKEKSLVSVLRAAPSFTGSDNDAAQLKANLWPENKLLKYVDFHSYPRDAYNSTSPNPFPVPTYDHLTNLFSSSGVTVLMGEFGKTTPFPEETGQTENDQESFVSSHMTKARDNGFPYYLHWTLWDKTPPLLVREEPGDPNSAVWFHQKGLGYDPNMPKDALATVAVEMHGASPQTQLVPNSDMELVDWVANKAIPRSWSAGGTGLTPTLKSGGPTTTGAATNSRYTRVEVPAGTSIPSNASVWLASDPVDVTRFGTANRRLFVNGYVRGSIGSLAQTNRMKDVRIEVVQYDASSNEIIPPETQERARARPFDPTVWSWSNFLHAMPGIFSWSVDLEPGTKRVEIRFSAVPTGAPSVLDVDAVSAAVRVGP